jgi:3-hydroxyacyl-CoA dehydrogenase/enoyl-CoA hydratase/3-hydroxybutyryl-CoA epimerase
MDEFGRNGKRTGKGFYDYPEGGKKTIWPGLVEHFTKAEKVQIDEAEFEELKERLLYRQSIESVRCFEEGVLTSVADANIGSIFGIGMAPWTGGVLQYINYVGVAEFVQRADALAAKHGDRFTPPQLLRDMAASGKTFE